MLPNLKRCRLSLLTNSALVYESQCGGMGGVATSQPMSTAEHRSPNKLWRSTSIFNLCSKPSFMITVWRARHDSPIILCLWKGGGGVSKQWVTCLLVVFRLGLSTGNGTPWWKALHSVPPVPVPDPFRERKRYRDTRNSETRYLCVHLRCCINNRNWYLMLCLW